MVTTETFGPQLRAWRMARRVSQDGSTGLGYGRCMMTEASEAVWPSRARDEK